MMVAVTGADAAAPIAKGSESSRSLDALEAKMATMAWRSMMKPRRDRKELIISSETMGGFLYQ